MNDKTDLERRIFTAARDQGISNVLFRNSMGRKLGLNVSDNECLSFLTIKGGVASPTELANYTGLTTGSTTAMLDRLEKAGFIRRKANPNDRRGILIEICSKWRETSGPLVIDIQKANKKVIARYSKEELETIIDFLIRFTDNVKEQTKLIENTSSKHHLTEI